MEMYQLINNINNTQHMMTSQKTKKSRQNDLHDDFGVHKVRSFKSVKPVNKVAGCALHKKTEWDKQGPYLSSALLECSKNSHDSAAH